MNILAGIFSWSFGVGVLIGLGLDRAWRYAYASWLNRHHPLPRGRKYRPPGFNFTALGVTLALAVITFAIYKVQDTANHQRQLAAEMQTCQQEFFTELRAQAAISDENDRLSRDERTAFANWLRELLNPPPVIAALGQDDPRYQQWGLGVTGYYYAKIKTAEDQQVANDKERAAHPLPEPACGR